MAWCRTNHWTMVIQFSDTYMQHWGTKPSSCTKLTCQRKWIHLDIWSKNFRGKQFQNDVWKICLSGSVSINIQLNKQQIWSSSEMMCPSLTYCPHGWCDIKFKCIFSNSLHKLEAWALAKFLSGECHGTSLIHLSASSTLDVATSSLVIKVGHGGSLSHTSHTKDTRGDQLYCS